MAKRITWADRENNPAKSLLGVNHEAPATIYNTLKEKANNPGKKISFPVSGTTVTVNADDEFYFSDYTQTGVLNFEAEAGLPQNVGVGNGITGIIISNGDDITFSSDFNVTYPATFEAGESYYLNLFWNGVKFQGLIQKVGEETSGGGPESNTWYVDQFFGGTPDGSPQRPFTTIQAAIDVARDQDIIYVNPGTYIENLSITQLLLTISGRGDKLVTNINGDISFDGSIQQQLATFVQIAPTGSIGYINFAPNVYFDNCFVSGTAGVDTINVGLVYALQSWITIDITTDTGLYSLYQNCQIKADLTENTGGIDLVNTYVDGDIVVNARLNQNNSVVDGAVTASTHVIKNQIDEAPVDGNLYGRKDNGWEQIPVSSMFVENEYDNAVGPGATLFGDQANQTAGKIQQLNNDFNGILNPNSWGKAWYLYLGTTNGNFSDYEKISSETMRKGGIHDPVADITALKALPTSSTHTFDNWIVYVAAENAVYSFDKDSTETEDLPNIVQPTAGGGRFVRVSDVVGEQVTIGGQLNSGSIIKPYDVTPDFDMNDGNIQKMVLTGNSQTMVLSNKVNGSFYRIIIEQGGSGSYTILSLGSSFGTRTNNSVDDSGGAGTWEPTAVGSKIIIDVTVEPDGDTFYEIQLIGT